MSDHNKEPSEVEDSFDRLLNRASDGDESAHQQVFDRVYDELRRLARRRLGSSNPNGTLQPTVLVHEAYVRLLGKNQVTWRNRRHFFALVSRAMRDIIVERARYHATQKRGMDMERVTFESDVIHIRTQAEEILTVNDVLSRLYERDRSTASLIALRYFVGLTVRETAHALGVSESTVERRWNYAKAVLHRELGF